MLLITLSVVGHPVGGGDPGVGDGVLPPPATVLLARVAGVVAAGTMTRVDVVGAVEVTGGAGGVCTVDEGGGGGGYNTTTQDIHARSKMYYGYPMNRRINVCIESTIRLDHSIAK